MKNLLRSFSFSLLLFIPGMLLSQAAPTGSDPVYGLDPLLYNGKKYTYFLPPGTVGNQFLHRPDFYLGSATIKGTLFSGIILNYDVFNQELLLQYTAENGTLGILEVSKAWLEAFRLGEMAFIFKDYGEGPNYYQRIGDEDPCILYHWTKQLKLDVTYGTDHFAFTPPMRDSWVLKEGMTHPYKSRHSFLKIFSQEDKPLISDYMRQHRIRIKKASDADMTQLIHYINSLD